MFTAASSLEEARPSPLPPIQFKNASPREKEKAWKGGNGARVERRVREASGGVRVTTQSERTKESQATTRVARAKSVEVFAKVGSSGVPLKRG